MLIEASQGDRHLGHVNKAFWKSFPGRFVY